MANYPLTNPNFRVVRGVQSEIDFFIRDIDRHPAVLTGNTLTISIIDPILQTQLLSRTLVLVNSDDSIYRLILLQGDALDWDSTLAYSVSMNRSDGSTVMLWTDMQYGVHGRITVVEGPVPDPLPSIVQDPASYLPVIDTLGGPTTYYGSPVPSAGQYGLSGAITLAATLAGFTGTLRLDASLQPQVGPGSTPDWFTATSASFAGITGLQTITTTGNYMWVRLAIIPDTPNGGAVSSVTIRA